ncbi:MAG: hypothetical protein IPI21_03590 [Propionivibrio sp.]|nr:hypothetical protein [Propionivibrio sp.]
MNKYQRLVVVAATMNVLVMLLFPPFTSQPLAKGVLPSFDGFYPIVSQLGHKPLFTELLTIQLMFVGINTLVAWLALQTKTRHGKHPDFRFAQAIGWFVAVNLIVIFTFPPFEPYQLLLRADAGGFDSFYFVLGSRSQRTIYWPLLYLECMLVAINALGIFLMLSSVQRGADDIRRKLAQLADDLPEEAIERIAADIRQTINAQPPKPSASLGRGADRRRTKRKAIAKERRSGKDRRHQDSSRTGDRP